MVCTNFDSQKVFIGLMDFFSILLPGALLTYLLMGEVGPVVLGASFTTSKERKAGPSFLRELSLRPPSLSDWRVEVGRASVRAVGMERSALMTAHKLFYYPSASFTHVQLSLLKVTALYFEKLFILHPVVQADRIPSDQNFNLGLQPQFSWWHH